jgi:hypothetical protein
MWKYMANAAPPLGQTTIAALTGDRVIYRDLRPCDERLPGIEALRAELGLPAGYLPRKRDRDYARVVQQIAQAAQALRGGPPLRSCLVIGDTENDRMLAYHLANIGSLRTWGFIGVDQLAEPAQYSVDGPITQANRWGALGEWRSQVEAEGIAWPTTALLIDIDKTLLGPRGRTVRATDDSRAAGALRVARDLFGPALDGQAFRTIYDRLCRKEYHPFTLDNQDYVVYSALLIAGGALSIDDLDENLTVGRLSSFAELLAATAPLVPAPLADLHSTIAERVAQGDPTPFKRFRHAELEETVARMADGRLTICRELIDLASDLVMHGALCMAASDKPAEASIPSPAQRAAGLLPLHWTKATLG